MCVCAIVYQSCGISFSRTSGKFDRLSGSKIVELIISKVNVDGVHHIMEILQQMLTGQACSEPQGWVGLLNRLDKKIRCGFMKK